MMECSICGNLLDNEGYNSQPLTVAPLRCCYNCFVKKVYPIGLRSKNTGIPIKRVAEEKEEKGIYIEEEAP